MEQSYKTLKLKVKTYEELVRGASYSDTMDEIVTRLLKSAKRSTQEVRE